MPWLGDGTWVPDELLARDIVDAYRNKERPASRNPMHGKKMQHPGVRHEGQTITIQATEDCMDAGTILTGIYRDNGRFSFRFETGDREAVLSKDEWVVLTLGQTKNPSLTVHDYGFAGADFPDQDVVEAMARKVAELTGDKARKEKAAALAGELDQLEFDREELKNLYDELYDELDSLAPPYTHVADNRDTGSVWFEPGMDAINEAIYEGELVKVDDTSKVPARYTGEVLHVSDHGNMTLYRYRRGRSEEVWSVV